MTILACFNNSGFLSFQPMNTEAFCDAWMLGELGESEPCLEINKENVHILAHAMEYTYEPEEYTELALYYFDLTKGQSLHKHPANPADYYGWIENRHYYNDYVTQELDIPAEVFASYYIYPTILGVAWSQELGGMDVIEVFTTTYGLNKEIMLKGLVEDEWGHATMHTWSLRDMQYTDEALDELFDSLPSTTEFDFNDVPF